VKCDPAAVRSRPVVGPPGPRPRQRPKAISSMLFASNLTCHLSETRISIWLPANHRLYIQPPPLELSLCLVGGIRGSVYRGEPPDGSPTPCTRIWWRSRSMDRSHDLPAAARSLPKPQPPILPTLPTDFAEDPKIKRQKSLRPALDRLGEGCSRAGRKQSHRQASIRALLIQSGRRSIRLCMMAAAPST